MNDNGKFGFWFIDQNGLPAYNYNINQYKHPNATYDTTYGTSIDHYHQIGNDRISATVHNGGYVQVLDSSRGFQWLTRHSISPQKNGGGIALLIDGKKIHSDLYSAKNAEDYPIFERTFGMGYFEKMVKFGQLKLIHTICTPFSDDPVVISEIVVQNESEDQFFEDLQLIDFWDVCINHIMRSLIVTSKNRKQFGKNPLINLAGKTIKFFQKIIKKDTDAARIKFDNKFIFSGKVEKNKKYIMLTPKYKKDIDVGKHEPGRHNFFPDNLFLSMLKGDISSVFFKQENIINNDEFQVDISYGQDLYQDPSYFTQIQNPCLGLGTKFSLKPKEKKKVIFIFGYTKTDKIIDLIDKYRSIVKKESILAHNARGWSNSLMNLEIEGYEWLSREIQWHSYYTRSACFFDEYFQNHRFPQGSIYQFGHGLDGAIRDYSLYLHPIILTNPKLAREYILYMLQLMESDGMLPYSVYGFAKTFTGSVHSNPSDLYLFLLWAILQYLYLTQDFDFLKEKVNFYPKISKESTVLDRIYLTLNYLFSDKVGFGKHGLLKINDGDWSDGISLMVKKRKKFIKYGESTFNSALGLYVFRKLIPLLENHNEDLTQKLEESYENLLKSVMDTYNGKWYFRGWDGSGNPIGNKTIYLEHHTWLLVSQVLDSEKVNKLIEQIYTQLDEPSPIGQYLVYPPEKTPLDILPEGWDVNGGIWHAMNALLTWGYSLYDKEKGLQSLIKNSMAKRAEVYPDIWYGIWSGPDAYIADYSEDAGKAFFHFTTPMRDFPVMNLNAHACYLLSAIKMAGLQANYEGIQINPNILPIPYEFKSPLISIIHSEKDIIVKYKPIGSRRFKIHIEKPDWFDDAGTVIFNEKTINANMDEYNLTDTQIIITNSKLESDILIKITKS